MYKFLLIDDEAVVREGIRDNIPWAKHGFEFVGACADGSEALEAVERLHPDVILTDICMPFVDGLEFARMISDQYPAIKLLLLTGHDEFAYAREAVKLQVTDFLLKPITAAELCGILTVLREKMDAERQEKQGWERLKIQLEESLPLLRERFLTRLVAGNIENIDFDQRMRNCGIRLEGTLYQVMIIDADGGAGELNPEMESLAVKNICDEVALTAGRAVSFQNSDDHVVIVFSGFNAEKLEEQVLAGAEKINYNVKRYLGITVSAGIGNQVAEIPLISSSYQDAGLALDYRFTQGTAQIIHARDLLGTPKKRRGTEQENWSGKLVMAIRAASKARVTRVLGEMMESLRKAAFSKQKCSITLHKTLASIYGLGDEMGMRDEEILPTEENPFRKLQECKTLDEVEQLLCQLCQRIILLVSARRDNHSRLKALEAQQYIGNHFYDSHISLGSVCRALAVSSSYFSPVFKKHSGKTFVEYLTDLRIDRAKLLLLTSDLKQYEIADRVGFRDPHYFSMIFKRITGLSPSDYRKQIEEIEE